MFTGSYMPKLAIRRLAISSICTAILCSGLTTFVDILSN